MRALCLWTLLTALIAVAQDSEKPPAVPAPETPPVAAPLPKNITVDQADLPNLTLKAPGDSSGKCSIPLLNSADLSGKNYTIQKLDPSGSKKVIPMPQTQGLPSCDASSKIDPSKTFRVMPNPNLPKLEIGPGPK